VKKTKHNHNIIAMIYDFDGTLSPNNMQEDTIFKAYGIDKEKFWEKSQALAKQGYERTLAYLKLLIHDEIFLRKPIRRSDLTGLANEIEYYPGVRDFFDRIAAFVAAIPEFNKWGVEIEHYIISSGMKEILEGADIYHHFKKVYACEYDYEDGRPIFPKVVINDTNKTQFLFRINKGKLDLSEDINSHMEAEDRRIPFRNMIYIGDSLTDIPSMTVMHKFGGHSVAVFDPQKEIPPLVMDMVREKRADHLAPADFQEDSLLTKILHQTLKKMIHTIVYHSSADMSFELVTKIDRG